MIRPFTKHIVATYEEQKLTRVIMNPASLTLDGLEVRSVRTQINFPCGVKECPEICVRSQAPKKKKCCLHFVLTGGHYVKASQPILYRSNILASFKDTAAESAMIFNSFSIDITKGQVSKMKFSIMIVWP